MTNIIRAYDANAARLLRAATLVYTVADIKRNIALRLRDGAPCNLELGADIELARGLIIPDGLTSFSLSGAGRFRIIATASMTSLITVGETAAAFTDFDVIVNAGVTVTNVFVVDQAGSLAALLDFATMVHRVTVDGTNGTVVNVFALGETVGTSTILGRVDIDELSLVEVQYLFGSGTAGSGWQWCRVHMVLIDNPTIGPAAIGDGSSSPYFIECTFDTVVGSFSVDIGSNSNRNTWSVIVSNNTSSFTTNGTGSQFNSLRAVDGFVILQLSGADIDLDAGTNSSAVTLSIAGPSFTPPAKEFVRMTHTAGASGNVTINAGRPGQRMTLFFASVAGTAVYTDGAGNLQLSANFTPTTNDTLSLIYDTTTASWVETARSVN